ncbi:polysaccharide biosynthesis protein [Paenibacillus sp. FSL H8-0034]|uniref:polysaccharide biosynthesis protein n=1 Tax=Paenibacillus sp. FSL H8-0034 TaxID=2954671 RepID=UPI0030F4E39E
MLATVDDQLRTMFQGKNVLITGATGTLGEALALHIQAYAPRIIRLFSRDEHKQFLLSQKLGNASLFRFLIGDVRDYERLLRATEDVDIVLHTAAMKHVPICEYNPFEAIQTNVMGTQNVILACIQNKVKKLLVTSSDKAVSPLNTMGATKLLAERLVTAAAYAKGSAPTVFCSVRFGNVIGSRGSVVHTFLRDLKQHKPLRVTDPNMTRFMMSVDQAVALVLKALLLSQGGDVFVLKMPVVRLNDLVRALIEQVWITPDERANAEQAIQIIGVRPGEKTYEDLLSEEEGENALEWKDMFVLPPWWHIDHLYPGATKCKDRIYSSKDLEPLDLDALRSLLHQSRVLESCN